MKASAKLLGTDQALAVLKRLGGGAMERAMAVALNRTAAQVKAAQVQAMKTSFDRPTKYTLNSLWIEGAAASQQAAGTRALPINGDPYNTRLVRSRYLEAQVGLKDDSAGSGTPATKYLAPQIFGGPRNVKRFEKALQAAGAMPRGWVAIPAAGARLDAYGNLSKGQITQILSQVGVELTAGYNRGIAKTGRKRINALKRAGGQFFVALPGKSKLHPGVYQREFIGRNITPVVIFARSASYRPRYDFEGVGMAVAQREIKTQALRAFKEFKVTSVAGGVAQA